MECPFKHIEYCYYIASIQKSLNVWHIYFYNIAIQRHRTLITWCNYILWKTTVQAFSLFTQSKFSVSKLHQDGFHRNPLTTKGAVKSRRKDLLQDNHTNPTKSPALITPVKKFLWSSMESEKLERKSKQKIISLSRVSVITTPWVVLCPNQLLLFSEPCERQLGPNLKCLVKNKLLYLPLMWYITRSHFLYVGINT